MKKKFPRIRYCKRCNILFHPTSKYSKICDNCNIRDYRITNNNTIKTKGFEIEDFKEK